MTPDEDIPEREAQVMHMLHHAAQTERAPLSLRAEVEDLRRQAARRKPSAGQRLLSVPGRLILIPRRAAAAAATSCAGVVVALVLILSGGVAGPSIAAAAALATRGASAPAPAPDPQAPTKFLTARVGDLRFPNWEQDGGWRSSGERTDRLGNREVTTVYYSRRGHQLAYSIVSQPQLNGLDAYDQPYETMRQHGRRVIVWTEDKHTCVLSAVGISAPELWRLAASTFTR